MVIDIKKIDKMINVIPPILIILETVPLYFFIYCNAKFDRSRLYLGGHFVLFLIKAQSHLLFRSAPLCLS